MNTNCNFGVVGAGYMGKAHASALHAVGTVFNTNIRPIAYMLCTTNEQNARKKSQQLGFRYATGSWQKMVDDPKVDAIIIASPQSTHKDIALAAFAKGKHVFCEKPMSASLEDSILMTDAANKSGKAHMVGFNYIRTPASQMARKMVKTGVLGTINYMRAEHTEDFLSDPNVPFGWRCQGRGNGTVGDLAPHIINAALAIMGDIESLTADIATMYKTRPHQQTKGTHPVTNDDQGHCLCRFKNGAMGSLFFSRIATGQKMGYRYEIYGSKGAIKFDQEDQNALWYFDSSQAKEFSGFTKILTSTAHPDFASLCPGDGHGTGYQEQIIIEMRDFLQAIETNQEVWPSFNDGLEVEKVVDTIFASAQSQQWVQI